MPNEGMKAKEDLKEFDLFRNQAKEMGCRAGEKNLYKIEKL